MSELRFFEITAETDIADAYPVLGSSVDVEDPPMADFAGYAASLQAAHAQGYIFIGCRQADKLVGVSGIRIMHDPWSNRPYAYINNLAVLPQHQGQGIGTKLLIESSKVAKNRGAHSVGLNVHMINTKAIKLYESLNYKAAATLMWRDL